MATISDFNSLWEVGFAVNAIFIFFDYNHYVDNKIKEIQEIGDEYLNQYFDKTKFNFSTMSCANLFYKWLPVKCHVQKQILKIFSIFNSLLTFIMLLVSSYFANMHFSVIFSVPIVLIIFGPLLHNVVNINFILPKAVIEATFIMFDNRLEEWGSTLNKEEFKSQKEKIDMVKFLIRVKYRYLFFGVPDVPPHIRNE